MGHRVRDNVETKKDGGSIQITDNFEVFCTFLPRQEGPRKPPKTEVIAAALAHLKSSLEALQSSPASSILRLVLGPFVSRMFIESRLALSHLGGVQKKPR